MIRKNFSSVIHIGSTDQNLVARKTNNIAHIKITFGNLANGYRNSSHSGEVNCKQLFGTVYCSYKVDVFSVWTPHKLVYTSVPIGGKVHFEAFEIYNDVVFIGFIAITFHLQPSQVTRRRKLRRCIVP